VAKESAGGYHPPALKADGIMIAWSAGLTREAHHPISEKGCSVTRLHLAKFKPNEYNAFKLEDSLGLTPFFNL